MERRLLQRTRDRDFIGAIFGEATFAEDLIGAIFAEVTFAEDGFDHRDFIGAMLTTEIL